MDSYSEIHAKIKANPLTSNHGKRWSKDEEYMLVREINSNMSIVEIAQIHKRTESGINKHIEKMAYDDFKKNNESIENICIRYKISNIEFDKIIKTNEVKNGFIKKENLQKSENEILIEIRNILLQIEKNTRNISRKIKND